jgi:hypothetical protein
MTLLEGGYRLFLPVRPTLAWAFKKFQAVKKNINFPQGKT